MSVSQSGEVAEVDWARVFTKFLCLKLLSYEEIMERTIPQLNAISEKFPEFQNFGCPLLGGIGEGSGNGSLSHGATETDKEHSVSDGLAFAALFNGIC